MLSPSHARSSPGVSLGIATFSSAQRDAIEDVLEIKRRSDDALDELLREGKDEDVFVKNLENVQGDERDVIFVSVGYGPRVAGARLDSMAFGPVSADGGERRLNVLFTRARSRCEIFVSFAAGDIDLDRAKGEGPRILKRFLQYAESGRLRATPRPKTRTRLSRTPSPPSSRASATRSTNRLGPPASRSILLSAIPTTPDATCSRSNATGRPIIAACGHGSATGCARKSWKTWAGAFTAIWSTDWFYRRAEAAQKLRAALEIASSTDPRPRQPEPPSAAIAGNLNEPAASAPQANVSDLHMPPYKLAEGVPVPANLEPHQVAVTVMARITEAIVNIEGPIHQDEVARRVTSLFGKSRTGSLISAAALGALQMLKASRTLIERNDFWMTQAQLDNPPARDRSGAPLTLQRADMLSPLEIRAAIKVAERENGAMSADDAAIAVTRLLGFKRTGPDLRAAILKAVRT